MSLAWTAACSLETPSVRESCFAHLFFFPDACPSPSRWGPYAEKGPAEQHLLYLQLTQSPLLQWRALINLFPISSAPSPIRPLRMRAWPLLQVTVLCLLFLRWLIMRTQMLLLTVPPVFLWVSVLTGWPVDFLQSFYSMRRDFFHYFKQILNKGVLS